MKWTFCYVYVCVLQQHNTELVVGMVRQQFKKHMNETDPEKIQKLKDEWVFFFSPISTEYDNLKPYN